MSLFCTRPPIASPESRSTDSQAAWHLWPKDSSAPELGRCGRQGASSTGIHGVDHKAIESVLQPCHCKTDALARCRSSRLENTCAENARCGSGPPLAAPFQCLSAERSADVFLQFDSGMGNRVGASCMRLAVVRMCKKSEVHRDCTSAHVSRPILQTACDAAHGWDDRLQCVECFGTTDVQRPGERRRKGGNDNR